MLTLISTPKFRRTASQLCGIVPYYCLGFTFGTAYGFQIILIAELYKNNSEISMTLDQLTWLASLNFLNILSSVISGFLTQRLGSRFMALTAALLYVASWLLQYYSTDATTTFLARVLSIVSAPTTIISPYISEISEPHLRGSCLAISQLAMNGGSFFSLLLGTFMYWRTIALVNIVFPILSAVAVLATPNSPTWLASKGRLVEAEEALCWLRGWVHPNEVQAEFHSIVASVDKSASSEQNVDIENFSCSKQYYRPFFQRSFYLPLITMFAIFLTFICSGCIPIESYSTVIFTQMSSPIDETIATAIMAATAIVGNMFVLIFIHRFGKRKMIFFSVIVVGLCQAIVAIIGFFELKEEYLWVPPIAVIVGNAVDSAGAGTVVWIIVSEIFPSHVRYIGTSISMSVMAILMSVANKLFLYVVEAISLSGTFLLFALMNLVSLGVYYFLFPETEGKSLQEIEDLFKSVEDKKNRAK